VGPPFKTPRFKKKPRVFPLKFPRFKPGNRVPQKGPLVYEKEERKKATVFIQAFLRRIKSPFINRALYKKKSPYP